MRWPSFLGRWGSDRDDPELTSLFADARARLDAGTPTRSTAQIKVARLLRQPANHEHARASGVLKRFAWASGGGIGMWGALLSTAAAHKAVAVAVGLGMLLGGTVAVETTGVGTAVREAVVSHQASSPHAVVHPTPAAEGTSAAGVEPDATALPGALITQLHADGSFTVRGQLVEGTDASTAVVDTGADTPLSFTYDAATVHATGRPERGSATPTPQPVDLTDYVGYGVFITGSCADDPLPATLGDCNALTLSSIQVLGRAGQQGEGPAAAPGKAKADNAPPNVDAPQPSDAAGAHRAGNGGSATPPAGLSNRPDR
jgi:hypothetical protein